jgi:hypothetical protein
LRLRLILGDSRLEPAEQPQESVSSIEAARVAFGLERDCQLGSGNGKDEIRWKNADDGVVFVVKVEGFADQRIAPAETPPQASLTMPAVSSSF